MEKRLLISSKQQLGNRRVYCTYMVIMIISFTHVAENSTKTTLILCYWSSEIWQISTDKAASNYCKDIEEYFEEISIVIRQINDLSKEPIYLLGHSTGGLTASSYEYWGWKKPYKCSYFKFAFSRLLSIWLWEFFSYWGSKLFPQ
jgi:hypothetical protein